MSNAQLAQSDVIFSICETSLMTETDNDESPNVIVIQCGCVTTPTMGLLVFIRREFIKNIKQCFGLTKSKHSI